MVKLLCAVLLLAGLSGAAAAAPKNAAKAGKTAKASSETLAPGRYTAHVAMLACSECGRNVEKVLNETKGIERAKADSDKSTVTFTVKPGSKIEVVALQQKLKASADEMGMGADYRLSKITALKKS